MTGLLVSVRSAAEARIALDAGADLIDVKEPSRGSLGRADAAVWRDVAEALAGRVPVSVALGELIDAGSTSAAAVVPTGGRVQFAKLGLAGAARLANWQRYWLQSMAELPENVQPVAAAYADWQTAHAPPPHEVLAVAARLKAPCLLIDTYDKSRGNLLVHCPVAELTELAGQAADRGIRLVLAGSLDRAAIARLAPLAPAYFAVRSAACVGDRTQAIEASRVKRLVELVRTTVGASPTLLLDTGTSRSILPPCAGRRELSP